VVASTRIVCVETTFSVINLHPYLLCPTELFFFQLDFTSRELIYHTKFSEICQKKAEFFSAQKKPFLLSSFEVALEFQRWSILVILLQNYQSVQMILSFHLHSLFSVSLLPFLISGTTTLHFLHKLYRGFFPLLKLLSRFSG
jgi:hypothetical protein